MRRVLATTMLGASFVLVMNACGETLPAMDADAASGTPDANGGLDGENDGSPADAAGEGCNPAAGFLPPVLVEGLPDSIRSFRLTTDEKVAFYARNGTLYRATMASPTKVEGATPVSLDFVSAPSFGDGGVQNASISGDGSLLYVEVGFELWSARKQTDGGYTATFIVTRHGNPFFDEPRQRVFATKYLDGGGIEDQEIVSGATNGDGVPSFSPVGVRVPAIDPVPAPDGTALFFATKNPLADYEIHEAALPAVADADVPVVGLNTTSFDAPTWMSADGCRLYIVTGRTNIFRDVYLARRGR